MADYRRFQPRRTASPIVWRPFAVGAGVVVILVLLGVWVFGGHGAKTSTNNAPAIALINDANTTGNTNALLELNNTNGAVNVNANTNLATTNSNTNTTVVAAPASATAILKACPTAVSQVGQSQSVALTFDIVNDNDAVTQLLTALAAAKAPATFFVTGNYAKDHGALLKRIVAAGFSVYSRGTTTANKVATMTAAAVTTDLQAADTSISAATGLSSKPFYRPPLGATSAVEIAAAHTAGFCTVTWTVDATDWDASQTVDGAVSRVMGKVRAGAIVLFGAGNDITPGIVTQLASQLPKQGYKLVSLAGLFGS